MALFTKENARQMAARAALLRKLRAEAKKAAVYSEPPTGNATAAQQPLNDDSHRGMRLMRVRAQLDRVDAMLATETDTRKLRDLATVAKELEEQERRLSNRSLPPTLKAPARQRSRPSSPSPIDE